MGKKDIVITIGEFLKFDFFFNELKRYSCLGGRTKRKDFFLFQLTVVFIFFSLLKICNQIGDISYLIAYIIFIFPPVLSSMIRRLHDVGRSGYVIPFSLVLSALFFFSGIVFFNKDLTEVKLYWLTVFCAIVVFYPVYLFCLPSQKTENEYDTKASHPIKHGIMMLIFITIPLFLTFAILELVEGVKSGKYMDVLDENEPLTSEEEQLIQELIQKQTN